MLVFLIKQKTAYEIRISDWGSDVCSSDLYAQHFCSAAKLCPLHRVPAENRKDNRDRSGTVPNAWRADNTGNRIFAHPVADWLLDNRQFSDCRTYCFRRYAHILVVHPPPQHSRAIGTATHSAFTATLGHRGPISVDSRAAKKHRPGSGGVPDPGPRSYYSQTP